jgi:patatin-like phospholipase/acyl hydrolase
MWDLIIGTSTGGILAMRLTVSDASGRPKFTAHQLVQLYSTNGDDIFKPWPLSLLEEASEEATFKTLMIQAMLPQAGVHARQQTRGKPVPWKAIFHPKYTAEGIESLLHQQFGDAALSRPIAGTHLAVTSFNLEAV